MKKEKTDASEKQREPESKERMAEPKGDTKVGQKTETKKKGKLSFVSDFLFVFVLTLFLLVTLIMLGTKLLGYQMLTVDSGSMEPNFPEDSLIFVKTVDPSELQEDDVITFTVDENGTLVTHRIVAVLKDERSFITRGDANNTNDPNTVPFGNVVGKAELCLPKAGAVFRVVTAQENRVYVYIVIGILIGLTVMWIILDHIKKKKAKAIPKEAKMPTDKPESKIDFAGKDIYPRRLF